MGRKTMQKLNIPGVVLSLLFLASCATTYGPKGTRGGYSETRIDEVTYQVTFEGNQNSSREQVRTNLMYRCCELTRQNGYQYFIILSDDSKLHTDDRMGKADVTLSKGMGSMVNAKVEVEPASDDLIGIFTIQMLPKADPKYASFLIDAEDFMNRNEHAIKKR